VNDLGRALVIAAVLLGGAFVVRGTFGIDRYRLVPAGGSAVYRIDGLTGGVVFCTPAFCRPLPMLVPREGALPGGVQPGAPAPQSKTPSAPPPQAT
jgi:hypothetical protein